MIIRPLTPGLLLRPVLLPANVPCPLPEGGFQGRFPLLILEGHLHRACVSRLSFAVSPYTLLWPRAPACCSDDLAIVSLCQFKRMCA